MIMVSVLAISLFGCQPEEKHTEESSRVIQSSIEQSSGASEVKETEPIKIYEPIKVYEPAMLTKYFTSNYKLTGMSVSEGVKSVRDDEFLENTAQVKLAGDKDKAIAIAGSFADNENLADCYLTKMNLKKVDTGLFIRATVSNPYPKKDSVLTTEEARKRVGKIWGSVDTAALTKAFFEAAPEKLTNAIISYLPGDDGKLLINVTAEFPDYEAVNEWKTKVLMGDVFSTGSYSSEQREASDGSTYYKSSVELITDSFIKKETAS